MPVSEWWRSAAFYQIYVRSFQDSNGDGVGDLPGIRSRLPYLKELGVDALWLTPFYPSPQADHGYDVADYVDVDPLFGTLADFDALSRDAHELGLRVTIDIVPNHTSDQHEWFRNAIADPITPTGRATSSAPAEPAGRRTAGRPPSAARPGRSTSRPASTTSTSSLPSSPISTGTTRQVHDEFERDPPLLARPRRRRLSDRRRARALQGAGPARDGRAGRRSRTSATGSRR